MAVERLDCVVVGAGAVGLACAKSLTEKGREVVVLERRNVIGAEASSRNSEVIHAGLYYPHGSLKARLCVDGRDRLYAYLAERGVSHKRCGKLVVATVRREIDRLGLLKETAEKNGVGDIRSLSPGDARALEPELSCEAALLSPSTGIFDTHGFMLALQSDVENAKGEIVFNTPVIGGRVQAGGVALRLGGADPADVCARVVVNCAGVSADAVAGSIDGLDAANIPRQRYAKGRYFAYSGRPPFDRLIYPLPGAAGLGVHLTLDLGGGARLGPDVEWTDDPEDVSVPEAALDRFYDAARAFWPSLKKDRLRADYAGVRAKLHGPDEPRADFRIDGPERHGVQGLVNLYGVESPGLTAALAIGDYVARLALAE